MANAAAKKAQAARSSASSIYKPILIGINVLYVLIRLVYHFETYTVRQFFGSLIFWFLTSHSYSGILEDSAVADKSKKKSSTTSTSSSYVYRDGASKSDPLPGGESLDMLGLVVFLQFGTALFSDRLFWGLASIPLWWGYTTYKAKKGASSDEKDTSDKSGSGEDEALKERREKRAERRRNKWS
mmetsp:Transcript_42430/g.50910  ORF Transcript_42430/g.50910 Transcript_42430/m.50910 type:complete len:184 (+) Transcript_42430:47-598(+)